MNAVKIHKPIISLLFILSMLLSTACSKGGGDHPQIKSFSFKNDMKSELFTVFVNGEKIPAAVIPNVDLKGSAHIAESYKKLPEYCWVDSRYITAHYVHFAVDSTAQIRLQLNEAVKEFSIYPKRLQIAGEAKGNSLLFTVNRKDYKYYLVDINHLPMFVILLEEPRDNKPSADDNQVVSLKSFAEKETKDYTEAFQKAIEKINGTGKTLYIPAGEYLTEQITIEKAGNFNIYLDDEAIIKIKTSPAGENIPSAGIMIKNSHDIKISGYGCLDHQAYENFKDGRNDYHHGFPGYDYYFTFKDIVPNSIYLQSPIMMIYSKNITIDGLLIRNGRNYNVNSRHCDNVIIRNVKVLTPAGCVPENTDGINIGSYHNFHIEDCFIYSNDDCFSMGHNLKPYDNRGADNLVMENSFGFNPRANAIRLGWASNTHNGDLLFKDCDFYGMDDGAIILHRHTAGGDYSPDSLCYGKIRIENCNFDGVDRYTRQILDIQEICTKSLEFINVNFNGNDKVVSNVHGDKKKKIKELIMDNVRVGGVKVTETNYSKNFDIKNAEKVVFK
jgi:hypothetical protein